MVPSVQRSIRYRFSLAIIGVMTIIALIVATVLITYSRNTLLDGFHEESAGALKMAETSLATPLWQFNYDFFDDFLEALFSNRHFAYAAIIAHDEVVSVRTHPDFAEQDWAFFERSSKFITASTDISHDGQKVGSFQLATSTAAIRQELVTRAISIFVFSVILILAVSQTTLFITRRSIIQPLAELANSVTLIARGELEASNKGLLRKSSSRDEIGVLSSVFQHMLSYLQSMSQVATSISKGELHHRIAPKSEKDILGNAFQRMTSYLDEMGAVADSISQGDLREQIVPRSLHDQIGVAFAQMQAGLVSLIAKIRSDSDDIGSISEQMLMISSGNASALEHIGEAAEATVLSMQQMGSSAHDIRDSAERLRSAIDSIRQTVTSIEQSAQNSRDLSEFTGKTTSAVVHIMESLELIATQAEHSKTLSETTTLDAVSGREAVNEVEDGIASISEVTTHISSRISQLQNHSQAIGTILDVINDVSEQSALLSLNASIIAAQAGVHGRGFAVVAEAIREFSRRVGQSTQEIANIVRSVQQDSSEVANAVKQGQDRVEHGMKVAHKAGEALEKIERSAANSAQLTAEIADLVRQQTTSSTTISNSLQEVSTMITETAEKMHIQEEKAAQLFLVAENIQDVSLGVLNAAQIQQENTADVVESMDSVIALVLQNTETVQLLSESANALSEKAEDLEQQVENFRLPPSNSLT